MDPQQLQEKVQAFAHRLLDEANGDPVRALGLLVLVLDGSDLTSSDHVQRLVLEVRKILMPEHAMPETGTAIQHLAGDLSWEGVQHCLRCGKVLGKNCREEGRGLMTGHIYEIDGRLTADYGHDFDPCT